jgi:hypothetical protein
MTGSVRRAAATGGVLLALLAGGACGTGGGTDRAVEAQAPPPPLSAGPPSEGELPPGHDQSPDGDPPRPDEELTAAELTALLRTRAADGADGGACGPADVTAALSGFDAALGHRYTSLVLTNTSTRPCAVAGVPGIGARGEWGNRLLLVVEPGLPSPGGTGQVRLAPGAQARALLEWTGELAGQGAEHASLLVVQLAPGQVPVPLPASIDDAPDGAGDLDVGMTTTIRLGALEPPPAS